MEAGRLSGQTALVWIILSSLYNGVFSGWTPVNSDVSWSEASRSCSEKGGRIVLPKTIAHAGAVTPDSDTPLPSSLSHWVGMYRRRQYIQYLGCAPADEMRSVTVETYTQASFESCVKKCRNEQDVRTFGLMPAEICHCFSGEVMVNRTSTNGCFVSCTDLNRFKCGAADKESVYKLVNTIDIEDDEHAPGQCVTISGEDSGSFVFHNRNCSSRLYGLCENTERQTERSQETKAWEEIDSVCIRKTTFFLSKILPSSVQQYGDELLDQATGNESLWVNMAYIQDTYSIADTANVSEWGGVTCGYISREDSILKVVYSNCHERRSVLCEDIKNTSTASSSPSTRQSSAPSVSTSKSTETTGMKIPEMTTLPLQENERTDEPLTIDDETPSTVVTALVSVAAVVILGVCVGLAVVCYRKRCKNDDVPKNDQEHVQTYDNAAMETLDESAGATKGMPGNYVYASVNKDGPNKPYTEAEERYYSSAHVQENTYDKPNFGNSNDVYDHTNGSAGKMKTNTADPENIYNKLGSQDENVYDHTAGHSQNAQSVPAVQITENAYGIVKQLDDTVYDSASTSQSASSKIGHVMGENVYGAASSGHVAV